MKKSSTATINPSGLYNIGRKTGVKLISSKITRDEDNLDNVDAYWNAAIFTSPKIITSNNYTSPKRKKPLKTPTKLVSDEQYIVSVKDSKSNSPTSKSFSFKKRHTIDPLIVQSLDDIDMNNSLYIPDVIDQQIDILDEPFIQSQDNFLENHKKSRSSRKKHRHDQEILEIGQKLSNEPLNDYSSIASRKGQRKKYKPLEFWRNERFKYGRRESSAFLHLPAVIDVENKNTLQKPKPVTKRRKTESSCKKYQSYPDGKVYGTVLDSDSKLTNQLLMITSKAMNLKSIDKSLKMATTFSESDESCSFSSGIISIRASGMKSNTNSGDSILFFHVLYGTIQVTIHDFSFIASTGCQFIVPRGNQYELLNLSKKEARLVFCTNRNY